MLNMDMDTKINSIPFLATMINVESIRSTIDDFVKYYCYGYDINDDIIQNMIYKKNHINFNLLTDAEKDYIVQEVEKKIK